MPSTLPPHIGYAYAVELSIDEADADSVTFDRDVYFYVENFLDVPVGGPVPTGYYSPKPLARPDSTLLELGYELGFRAAGRCDLSTPARAAAKPGASWCVFR